MKWLYPALALAVLSCVDFELVGPEPNVPPDLSVAISARHEDGSQYNVDSWLFRGSDAQGEANTFSDRSLTVENAIVEPDAGSTSDTWRYSVSIVRPVAPTARDSVTVRGPALAESSNPMARIVIPIAAREEPGEIALSEGQDLRLHVSPVIGDSLSLIGGTDAWILQVRQSCDSGGRSVIDIQSNESYPPEIRVPWEWIRSAAQTPVAVCFTSISSYRGVGTPYPISVTVLVRVIWRIRIVTP